MFTYKYNVNDKIDRLERSFDDDNCNDDFLLQKHSMSDSSLTKFSRKLYSFVLKSGSSLHQ